MDRLMVEDLGQNAGDFGQYLIATPHRGRADNSPWIPPREESVGGAPVGDEENGDVYRRPAPGGEIARLEAQIEVLMEERLANLSTIKALQSSAEGREASCDLDGPQGRAHADGAAGRGGGGGARGGEVGQDGHASFAETFETFAGEMHGHLGCIMDLIGMQARPQPSQGFQPLDGHHFVLPSLVRPSSNAPARLSATGQHIHVWPDELSLLITAFAPFRIWIHHSPLVVNIFFPVSLHHHLRRFAPRALLLSPVRSSRRREREREGGQRSRATRYLPWPRCCPPGHYLPLVLSSRALLSSGIFLQGTT